MTNKEAIKILKSGGLAWDTFPRLKPAVIRAIEALENERPHGKWIVLGVDDNDNINCDCSVCGAGEIHSKSVNVPYCWKCGADMRGQRNDT